MLKEFSDPATSKQIGEHLKHNQTYCLLILLGHLVALLPAKHNQIALLELLYFKTCWK